MSVRCMIACHWNSTNLLCDGLIDEQSDSQVATDFLASMIITVKNLLVNQRALVSIYLMFKVQDLLGKF